MNHLLYLCTYVGVSEYAEYDDGNLNLERSDSHGGLDPAVFSDNPEVRSRRKAHGEHVEKRRISESSVKEERKRHVSRSELKRQLSRQVGETSLEWAAYIPLLKLFIQH